MLRWAVIGAGRFGTIHAEVLSELPGVQLAAVCGRTPSKLEPLAARLGVPATTDPAQLLEDPRIDVVSITTHWREHHALARAALLAGKHVLLEKPMAVTAAECHDLVSCAAGRSNFLMVGHICRFDPRVVLARQAIQAGRLGRIVTMHARRNLPVAPGSLRLDKISPLMGDGIHDADLMMWFMGHMPTRVDGRTLRVHEYRHPDAGWAILEFGEQAVGVIETVWCLPANVPTSIDAVLRVIGTEGQLTIDCGHTGLSILDGHGQQQPDTMYWPQLRGKRCGVLAAELQYFADCIRREQRPQVITPEEAARAVLVMETAEQAAAQGAAAAVRQDYGFCTPPTNDLPPD